jgi:3-isopropylmalate dehydratase small subunit
MCTQSTAMTDGQKIIYSNAQIVPKSGMTIQVGKSKKRNIMTKAWVYKQDHINTDEIIPAWYLNTGGEKELAGHCMEDLDKDFVKKVGNGDKVQIDYEAGIIEDNPGAPGNGQRIEFRPLPQFALEIIRDGGLLEHIKKVKS